MASCHHPLLSKKKANITILKVIEPNRFLVREAPSTCMSESSRAFVELEQKLNEYMAKHDIRPLESGPPEIGAKILVREGLPATWKRGQVKQIFETLDGYKIEVYLVDYGNTIYVPKKMASSSIRTASPEVLSVPAQAVEFFLPYLNPITLTLDEMAIAKHCPALTWDTAALNYVKSLVKNAGGANAEIHGTTKDGKLYGFLFIRTSTTTVRLDRELVVNTYAVLDKTLSVEDCSDENHLPGSPSSPTFTIMSEREMLLNNQRKEKQEEAMRALMEQCLYGEDNGYRPTTPEFQELLPIVPKKVMPDRFSLPESKAPCSSRCSSLSFTSEEPLFSDVETTSTASHRPPQLGRGRAALLFSQLKSVGENRFVKCTKTLTNGEGAGSQLGHGRAVCADLSRTVGSSPGMSVQSQSRASPASSSSPSLLSLLPVKNSGGVRKTIGKDRLGNLHDAGTPNKSMSPGQLNGVSDTTHVMCSPLSPRSSMNPLTAKLSAVLAKSRNSLVTSTVSPSSLTNSSPAEGSWSDFKVVQEGTSNAGASRGVPRKIVPPLTVQEGHVWTGERRWQGASAVGASKSHVAERLKQVLKKSSSGTSTRPVDTMLAAPKSLLEGPCFEEAQQVPGESSCPFSLAVVEGDDDGNNSYEDDEWQGKWEQFCDEGVEPAVQPTVSNKSLIRTKDAQKYASVPQDLEPYTQYKGDVSFDSLFELPHWVTRIEKKLVRALCHGVALPCPVFSLDEAHFDESIVKCIKSLGYRGPSCIQSVVWPAVVRGRSVIAIAPPRSGKSLSYLLPLLSNILSESSYESLPEGCGPLVLVLSSTWSRAQRIYDGLLMLIPEGAPCTGCVLYAGGSEVEKEVDLINGCEFLIATPMSFLRMVRSYQGTITNLKRCCHIVLDDGERLIEEFNQEVVHILTEFGSCLQERKSHCLENQIIVCSTQWTPGIESMLNLLRVQHCPLVFFSTFFEAAVYSKVPTFAHYCDHQAKDRILLELVAGCKGKKTVICTHSYASALHIHKLFLSMSLYSLFLHDRLVMSAIWEVESTWTEPHSVCNAPFLVAMDNVLPWANVRDATAIIHYDVPELSKFNFGFRYSCLADHMQSFNGEENKYTSIQESPVSHILLTAEDQELSVSLVEFLERLQSRIPPELLVLTEKELKCCELDKDLPLCLKLKAFGFCKAQNLENLPRCKNRHNLTVAMDSPASFLPSSGEVKILVTKIEGVTHYHGQILEQRSGHSSAWHKWKDGGLLDLTLDLTRHFSGSLDNMYLRCDERPFVGGLYALETSVGNFERVKVIRILEEDIMPNAPLRVELFHIDNAHESTASAYSLLHLPEEFARHPPYSVEVFCCRIQPQDRDVDWTFQADMAVHKLVSEKVLCGKVVLCLGNTLWIDPLVLYKHLSAVDVTLVDTHIRNVLISSGMACDNPNHLTRLREAAQNAGIPLPPLSEPVLKMKEDSQVSEARPLSCTFLELEGYNGVYLWKVYTPHRFYVQPTKNVSCIEMLERDISKYVSEKKLRRLKGVREGLLCLAPFTDDCFYRGLVESVSTDRISVFFPDYGDTVECSQEEVYVIENWMLLLPFQGIECRLAGVAPCGMEWDPEAAVVMEDIAFTMSNISKKLCARVFSHARSSHPGVRGYEISLHDTNSGCCIDVGSELVRRGLAVTTEMPVVQGLSNSTGTAAIVIDQSPPSSLEGDDLTLEDEETAEALNRYMDNVYSEIRDAVRMENENGLGNPVSIQSSQQPNHSSQRREFDSMAIPLSPPSLESCHRTLGSIQPNIRWWQDKRHVYMDICVAKVKTFNLIIKRHHVTFRTDVDGCLYEVYEELWDKVVVNSYTAESKPNSVRVTLTKAQLGVEWTDLVKRGYKVSFIQYDIGHLVCGDEAEDQFRSPYLPGHLSEQALPYDPVAHEDDLLEMESREDHIRAPLEDMYTDLDPSNPFEM